MKIRSKVIYNLGFFGGWREGNTGIDGHYKVIISQNEFIVLKIGDYGGFTSIKKIENPKLEILNDSGYRFIHDYILENNLYQRCKKASKDEIELFKNSKKYQIQDKFIGANIKFGDTVIDLKKNIEFKINHNDLKLLNRNMNYKILDRDVHPKEKTLHELIEAYKKINPFEGWTKLDSMPKKHRDWIADRYIIDGENYDVIHDYSGNGRYIIKTPKGEIWEKKSLISAPFYDTIDKLVWLTHVEYNDISRINYTIKDVKHESLYGRSFFIPSKFTKVTKEKSYDYNTRLNII